MEGSPPRLVPVDALAVVAPVNGEISAALRASPETVPALWTRLAHRWEYGHAAGFFVQLAALGALLVSVLVDTPKD